METGTPSSKTRSPGFLNFSNASTGVLTFPIPSSIYLVKIKIHGLLTLSPTLQTDERRSVAGAQPNGLVHSLAS